MMTGLVKLQLCNNSIETIDNLEMMVNLKELDLSFNKLAKIQNLDALSKLEVLTLFQNRIQVIENLDNLTRLTVFSIGNNRISDYSNVSNHNYYQAIKIVSLVKIRLRSKHTINGRHVDFNFMTSRFCWPIKKQIIQRLFSWRIFSYYLCK